MELTRLEYIYLERELKVLEGQWLQKVYSRDNLLRFKFSRHNLHVEIGKRLNLATPQGEYELNRIAQKLRKELRNTKLHKLSLIDMDRVVEFDFGEKRLVLEMFGKGNLFLLAGSELVFSLHGNEFKLKTTKPEELMNEEKNWGWHFSKLYGKKYKEYLLTRYGLREKELLNRNLAMKIFHEILAEIRPYSCRESFAVLPIKDCIPVEMLSPLIEKVFTKEEIPPRVKKLLITREQILNQIKEWQKQEEEARKAAEWIIKNYEKVWEILEDMKRKGEKKRVIEV